MQIQIYSEYYSNHIQTIYIYHTYHIHIHNLNKLHIPMDTCSNIIIWLLKNLISKVSSSNPKKSHLFCFLFVYWIEKQKKSRWCCRPGIEPGHIRSCVLELNQLEPSRQSPIIHCYIGKSSIILYRGLLWVWLYWIWFRNFLVDMV